MGESDHCYFFACKKAVVDVLMANSEYDVNLVKTRYVHFA